MPGRTLGAPHTMLKVMAVVRHLAHGQPVGVGVGPDGRHLGDDRAGVLRQRTHGFHLEAGVGQPLGQLVGAESLPASRVR